MCDAEILAEWCPDETKTQNQMAQDYLTSYHYFGDTSTGENDVELWEKVTRDKHTHRLDIANDNHGSSTHTNLNWCIMRALDCTMARPLSLFGNILFKFCATTAMIFAFDE
eukprot:332887_1